MRFTIALLFLCGAAGAQEPKTRIKVNFSSTGSFTESCGTTGTAAASGMTATQKASVVSKVQAKYDAVLPAGNVEVTEGSGGDVEIIVNGGKAPGALEGKEYGDAGKDGKPGVCHEGEFTADGYSGDDLVNAVAETVAHEAGHKLGCDHNCENPASLMTKGSTVDMAERTAGNRGFNADDSKKLNKNKTNNSSENKGSTSDTDLRVVPGDTTVPLPNKPDDRFLNSSARFLFGPAEVEFGFISPSGDFVFKGDATNGFGNETFMSFPYEAGVDLAVRQNLTVLALSGGEGLVFPSSPNPLNPDLFLQVNAVFNTQPNQTQFQLEVVNTFQTTGGFGPPHQVGFNYCQVTPNSTGFPTILSSTGSNSISANDLVLVANDVPQNPGFGIFIAGPQPFRNPIFNGFLCIAPQGLQRINQITPPIGNQVVQAIDYTGQSTGTAALNVMPGMPFHFQHWYRDPQAGGQFANLSDGYQVVLVP